MKAVLLIFASITLMVANSAPIDDTNIINSLDSGDNDKQVNILLEFITHPSVILK